MIDLHTHGIKSLHTRGATTQQILKMALLYAKAGTAAFVPTIYCSSIKSMRADLAAISGAMHTQMDSGRGAARILGANLEGPFLNPSRAGAQSRRSCLAPSLTSFRQLIKGYEDTVKIITIAPELPGALKIIQRASRMGIRVCMGHSCATYKQALRGKDAGASGVTHLFNAMAPLHHREVGLVGLALLDPDLYIEIVADKIHLAPETLSMILSIKPHNRILLVSDSIAGPQYNKGILQGSKLQIRQALENLASMGRTAAKRTVTVNARKFLGL